MSELAKPGEQTPADRPEWDSPHHRSPENSVGRLLLAAGIVLLLVVVAGGTTWWMYTRDPVADPVPAASPSLNCPSPRLRVVAAPEIAPVVKDAARTIGTTRAGCSPVEVTPEEPWSTITAGAQRKADVWIPSSSAWLGVAATAGRQWQTKGTPLARTPVVLAAPTAIRGLFAKGDQTSWQQLTAAVTADRVPAVSMPDAERSTVGMLSVFAVGQAMARSTSDPGIAQLRALTLRSRLSQSDSDPAALLTRVGAEWNVSQVNSSIGVFPVTEQQLKTYQKAGHTIRLDAAYPADGLVEADYPFAIAKASTQKDLAGRLHDAIGRGALTAAGFRVDAEKGALRLPADSTPLVAGAKMWSAYRQLSTQVMLLIDASGSMNEKFKDATGRTTTRAALLRDSGKTAAGLFAEDTSLGMWFFGAPTPASPAHTEVVSFGPISGAVSGGTTTRREALAGAMSQYRAPDNSGTPLYQSVLDASSEMQPKVRPGTVTLVVVLTDGDDGESKYAMPPAQFLQRLKAQSDPSRPVPIISVGYGPDANMKALNDMSAATGGKAFAASNPADLASAMAKAFLAAHQTQ